jgi:FdrA protein
LANDPQTRVLVVVSKPPSAAVAEKVVNAVRQTRKPAVVHFVGAPVPKSPRTKKIVFADSLAGTAEAAVRLAGGKVPRTRAPAQVALVRRLTKLIGPRNHLRGLFCGGTTGHEALAIISNAGIAVHSNLHKKGDLRVDGTKKVVGHVLLDLGDDIFTQGRPHPMIEPELRNERLAVELKDKNIGLLLCDVVLGYGSHVDPAGILARAVVAARKKRRHLQAIASITGTAADPQDYFAQQRTLEQAGIIVMPNNSEAAKLAAEILKRGRP